MASDLLQPSHLPGGSTLDSALVEHALVELGAIYDHGALKTAEAIGRFVLDTFFGGDVATFLARRRRHLSFRELTRHPDLPFQPLVLYRAVRLVEQQQQIPDVLTDQLGYSQQLALLPVRELREKLRLAERAVAGDWTVRQLQAEVREATADDPNRGRRRQPAFRKGVRKVLKGIDQATSEPFDPAVLETWSADEARALLEELDDGLEALGSWRSELVAALEGRG